MKILATFDRSKLSEEILPQLEMIARLPGVEFTLLGIARTPEGRISRHGDMATAVGAAITQAESSIVDARDVQWAENKGQAIDRARAEMEDYLRGIAHRLPASATVNVDARVSDHAAETIILCAEALQPDVIVMATHSRTGIAHILFGSTTEHVVKSGVAPVLVVHPRGA